MGHHSQMHGDGDTDALRRQFDHRPLLVLGAGLVIGLTSTAHPANLVFLAVAIAVLLRSSMRVVVGGGFLIGLLLSPAEPSPVLDRTYVDAIGSVVSLARRSPAGLTFNVAMAGRTWRVSTHGVLAPSLGDQVRVVGVGLPLREGSDRYFLLHGVAGRLDAARVSVVAAGPWPWRIAQAWRSDFRRFYQRTMTLEAAAFTEALCFDLNAGVDPAVTDRLKEIGTLHIVVASGLHVLMLAALLLYAMSGLPIPRAVQIAVVAFILLLYAGATGLTPAVVRAGLMAIVGMSAYLFRRDGDVLSALALAGILYLVWMPREVYDAGFQLSFVTVGGIALFYHPRRRETRRLVRAAYDAAGISWIAFVASAPLLGFYFGILSIVSLPANLLVGLAATVGITSAFVAHAVSQVLPAVGVGILTVVTEPMVGWILWISERLGGHSWSSVPLPAFSPYWLPVIYGLLLLTWRQRIVQP